MPQTDLAQVFGIQYVNLRFVLQRHKTSEVHVFKIRRAPGCETYVAMETSFMCTAQYFLKNSVKTKQGDIVSL